MSQQIQILRSKLKDYQRQLFNSENYEIQIRQLTDKCFRLESEKSSYREELFSNKQASQMIFNELQQIKKKYVTVDFTSNQKYKLQKSRNDELVMQVQKWKSRYNALDQSKSKELQTIKKLMSQQSKSNLSRQTKQLIDRFQLQKQQLQQELKELKQANISIDTEVKKAKFQLEKRESNIEELEKQNDEYEEKVALLSQENYRLLELSRSKQAELSKLKKQIQQLTIKNSQQLASKSQQNKKLMIKLQKYQQNVTQKQSKLTKLQKLSLNDKQKLSQLDRIVFLLKQREDEIQSKNKILQRKDKKIFSVEEKVKESQEKQKITIKQVYQMKVTNQQMGKIIEYFVRKFQEKAKQSNKIRQITQRSLRTMQQKYNKFKQELCDKNQKIMQHSNKLLQQTQQDKQYIYQMQQTLQQSKSEISKMQQQKVHLLQKITQLSTIKNQYELIHQQNQKMKKYMDRLVQERQQLMRQTQIKQSTILQSKKKMKQVQQNYENNVIFSLKKQLQTKNNITKQIENSLNQTQLKYKSLQNQMNKTQQNMKNTQKSIQQSYLQKISTIENELHMKQNELSKSNQYLQQMTKHLFTVMQNYQSTIKTQIQQLFARIQPIQNMILGMKRYFMQKVIKLQENMNQKQKKLEVKINQLVEYNVKLIEKTGRLYDELMNNSNNNSYNSSLNTLRRYKDQLVVQSSSTSIYTNGSSSNLNRLNSPRNTNQNYNSSNLSPTLNNNNIGQRIKQNIKGNFNNQLSSTVPIQFLIAHVLMCSQLQALRQRIGDKNAKVEKMKNSLMVSNVSSNRSFVAIVNGSGKGNNQNIYNQHHQSQSILDTSNIMTSTAINKLNPFTVSVAGTFNQQQNSFVQNYQSQSRFIQNNQRILNSQTSFRQNMLLKRVTSQQHPRIIDSSLENNSIDESRSNKNAGIYTKRVLGGVGGLGKGTGFKSISIKKRT